jgi:hypothetical protein
MTPALHVSRPAPLVPGDGMPRRIGPVTRAVDLKEVLRYLGYPAGARPRGGLAEQLEQAIADATPWSCPQAIYAVFAVEAIDRRSVRLRTCRGMIEFCGAIGEFLGPVESVAAFIATAGGELERRASDALKRGDHLTGLVYNAVGSERAEAAAGVVLEELRDQLDALGLAPTLPYSPGYCGMALGEQKNLFALFDGETAGVSLSPSLLMRPIKSISGLIGIGRAAEVRQHGSPCDRCELWTCQMRRPSSHEPV